MTQLLLSPKQKEVWQAILEYIDGTGKRFYAAENPFVIGDVLIAPRYGEGIKLSELKGLERVGLIHLRDPLNKGFALTDAGHESAKEALAPFPNHLSELLELGIQKMERLGLKKSIHAVFEFDGGTEQLIGCCALGAMVIASGHTPHGWMSTDAAVEIIGHLCPYIGEQSAAIWDKNDHSEATLPEIAAWLKEKSL